MDSDVVIGLGYLVAACLAAVAWRRDRQPETATGRSSSGETHNRGPGTDAPGSIWLYVAVILLAMGVGRLTDLGQTVSEIGRRIAISADWYDARRPVQLVAMLALIALLALSSWVLIRASRTRATLRSSPRSVMIVTMSLVVLGAIRTASLHGVDSLLSKRQVLGIGVGNVLEVAGLIGLSALALRSDHSSDTRGSPMPEATQ